VLDAAAAAELKALTDEFLNGREALFDARIADCRVLDGHGDLLAGDIFCLDDGPRILDCAAWTGSTTPRSCGTTTSPTMRSSEPRSPACAVPRATRTQPPKHAPTPTSPCAVSAPDGSA
jgi:hypothetical protein